MQHRSTHASSKALREVDRGVVEAAQAMGATTWQLVWRVLLPEARPGLIAGATITAIAVVGFTAMGGAIGSGDWVTSPTAKAICAHTQTLLWSL